MKITLRVTRYISRKYIKTLLHISLFTSTFRSRRCLYSKITWLLCYLPPELVMLKYNPCFWKIGRENFNLKTVMNKQKILIKNRMISTFAHTIRKTQGCITKQLTENSWQQSIRIIYISMHWTFGYRKFCFCNTVTCFPSVTVCIQ